MRTYAFIKDWIKNPLYLNMIRIAEKIKKGAYSKRELYVQEFSIYLQDFCKINVQNDIIVQALSDAILEGAKIKLQNDKIIF